MSETKEEAQAVFNNLQSLRFHGAQTPLEAAGRDRTDVFTLDEAADLQAGLQRPALIVSVDELNKSAAELVIVVPLTSREKRIRSHVEVDEGEHESISALLPSS